MAFLGFNIDSSQAVQASAALDKMTAASKQAENAAYALSRAANTKAQATLSAARASGTATKEEIAAAVAAVRKTRADYDAARAMRDSAQAAERQAAAFAASNNAMSASAGVSRAAGYQLNNLRFQLFDVAQTAALGMNPLMILLQQGPQIAQIYGPGEGGLGRAFAESAKMIGGFMVAIAPVAAAVGLVAAGLAGLTYEINKTADVQVSFFDVALAGWQLLAEQVAAWVAPVFGAIGSWLQQGWDAAAPVLKGAGNAIIATFVGAFEGVKTAWSGLPSAIGDLVILAVNGTISAVEGMLNNIIGRINNFMNDVRLKAYEMGFPLKDGVGTPIAPVTFDRVANPNAGAAGALPGDIGTAVGGAFQTDYLGNLGAVWSQRAQDIAAARIEMEDLGGATKSANDNFRSLGEDGIGSATQKVHWFAEAATQAFSNLGTGIIDAFKKGGDVGMNVFNMLLDKVSQLGESLLNQGLNGIFGSLIGNIFGGGGGQWGVMGGFSGFKGMFGLPSFDGGGWTGNGPRTGGLDGMGGFLAMMHPQEVVRDMTRPANQNSANDNRRGGDLHLHINGSGLNEDQMARAIANGIREYDAGLAPKVEAKFRTMQIDPRAADGEW